MESFLMLSFCFGLVLVFSAFCFEAGSHYVVQVGPSAGITGMYHHTWLSIFLMIQFLFLSVSILISCVS
jgi:hypothetical protein